MRLLIWHVDHVGTTPGQRGRSPVAEPVPWPIDVRDALLVFAAAEPADEADSHAVGERAASSIVEIAGCVKARTVVLHSFAHLFGELARPEAAMAALRATQAGVQARGLACLQTPFGWFNALDIQAKGHPLSRAARVI